MDKALARLRETARADHPAPPRNILAEAIEAAKVRPNPPPPPRKRSVSACALGI